MDKRLIIQKNNNRLKINIKAFQEKSKQKLLLLWIVLFSFCGVAILSQFFQGYDSNYKIVFTVYLVFWMFFEYKVIYAYRWRKWGEEKIILENNQISLTKKIKGRGITQSIELDKVKKIAAFNTNKASFFKTMNHSYWVVNNYKLAFYLEKSVIPFAIDVSDKEAKLILNELKKGKKRA